MILRERIDEYNEASMGTDPSSLGSPGDFIPGQPSVGHDPSQGKGTPAWQQALRMGLAIQARNRRN